MQNIISGLLAGKCKRLISHISVPPFIKGYAVIIFVNLEEELLGVAQGLSKSIEILEYIIGKFRLVIADVFICLLPLKAK